MPYADPEKAREQKRRWVLENPEKRREVSRLWGRRNHHKRVGFKGRRVYLRENPRRGICSCCARERQENEPQFHLHHEVYDSSNPLAHTKELCRSCHAKHHAAVAQERATEGSGCVKSETNSLATESRGATWTY